MCIMFVNCVRKKVVKKFCNEFWKEILSVLFVKLLSFIGIVLWNNVLIFFGMLVVNEFVVYKIFVIIIFYFISIIFY